MRVGFGFDAHRFVRGRPLILGGVEIPFSMGLEGFSDADVLVHAIADALLGAISIGDLGEHFPPGDPRYKNISSLILLQKVNELLAREGYEIINLDTVLILQEPKVDRYREEMKEKIAQTIGLNKERVSIKATTTEGLGFAGRGEGIGAQAVALVQRKTVDV
ncbi:MAG: 2-C-methyl-D-erythritol 2,4-cyclodiphosphate synthase [Actinomycetota bacterium]